MAVRRVEIRVSVDDIDAGKRLDALAAKLDKLTKHIWTIRVRLDDGGSAAKLDKMAAKLDKMGSETYTPKIDTSGITKADAQVDKLNAKFDKLSHKRVTVDVHTRSSGGTGAGGSLLRDLLGLGGGGGGGGRGAVGAAEQAAGGAGGGAGGGILSALAGANNSYMGMLIGALVALAAAVTPAVLPAGIGGLIGVGGTLAAGRLGVTGASTIRADRQALAVARAALRGRGGNTPQNRLQARQAQQALALAQSRYGGFVPFGHAVNSLGANALDSLLGALTGNASRPHGGTAPGTSFLSGMTGILQQIGGFLHTIGPGLGEMFRASLPFVQMFAKIFEQLAKLLMPAFTQSMKSLTPFIPQLTKGFVVLAQGLADFIKDLGPGMKDSVTVFMGLMYATKGILIGVAYGADYIAKAFANMGHVAVDIARNVHKNWDQIRHATAVDFDEIRHTIASMWDDIYQKTIARVIRIVQDVISFHTRMQNDLTHIYYVIGHDIASAWDMIWNNTVGRVERGYHDVLGWFNKLPGGIKNILGGLGKMFLGIATGAMGEFLSGLKSIGGQILSWVKNFFTGIPHDIMSLLHMSPPHPGSAFFDLGANFMHHLEAGMKSRVSAGLGGIGGHIGGSVSSWIIAALHGAGKPMSWLPALTRLVSLESGGNPRAVNPISVMGQHATGLWQMLPSTFYSYGGRGSLFNPIIEGIAALRYISSRYGSPFNIPGLFSGGYQGYARGGIITEPIFGMGLHSGRAYGFGENGIHERVTPLGSGGGGSTYIAVTVQGDTDPDGAALRIVQKLRKYKIRHGNAPLGIA